MFPIVLINPPTFLCFQFTLMFSKHLIFFLLCWILHIVNKKGREKLTGVYGNL